MTYKSMTDDKAMIFLSPSFPPTNLRTFGVLYLPDDMRTKFLSNSIKESGHKGYCKNGTIAGVRRQGRVCHDVDTKTANTERRLIKYAVNCMRNG